MKDIAHKLHTILQQQLFFNLIGDEFEYYNDSEYCNVKIIIRSWDNNRCLFFHKTVPEIIKNNVTK